jgi:hypothetical protein
MSWTQGMAVRWSERAGGKRSFPGAGGFPKRFAKLWEPGGDLGKQGGDAAVGYGIPRVRRLTPGGLRREVCGARSRTLGAAAGIPPMPAMT